jgi:LmbE family N-acetylglucosaminyl deacetylase
MSSQEAVGRYLSGGVDGHPCYNLAVPDGPVLVLAPHPDDETVGPGGALVKHVDAGNRIRVLFLTDGAAACRRSRNLPKTRRLEAVQAAGVLGIAPGALQFWNEPDGQLRVRRDLVERLAAELVDFKPDVIYTPFFLDDHRDHCTTAYLLAAALRTVSISTEVWCYEVWAPLLPNRLLNISHEMPTKLVAIQAHRSQIDQYRLDDRMERLAAMRALKVPAPIYRFLEGYYVCTPVEFVDLATGISEFMALAGKEEVVGYSVDLGAAQATLPFPHGRPGRGV